MPKQFIFAVTFKSVISYILNLKLKYYEVTRKCTSTMAMGKLKQLLAIVLMFWGTISMYGQSKMISGIVQSESDGEPLVGATVIVKETKAGGTTTSTDVIPSKQDKGRL